MMTVEMHPAGEAFLAIAPIAPDERERIPQAETRFLIEEVQSGSTEAIETLLSQRLMWIADRVVPNLADFQQANLEDVFQSAFLAVEDAAKETNLEGPTAPHTRFHSEFPRTLRKHLNEHGLEVVDNDCLEEEKDKKDVSLIPIEDVEESVLQEAMSAQKGRDYSVPENEVFGAETKNNLREALENLSYIGRRTLELRYGLYEHPRTYEEIARRFNLTARQPGSIRAAALSNLDQLADIYGIDEDAGKVDETNYGLRTPIPAVPQEEESEVSAEQKEKAEKQKKWLQEIKDKHKPKVPEPRFYTIDQLAKQQAWLNEIREKQEAGKIAFVKGDLLIRPLPRSISDFLELSSPSRLYAPNRRDSLYYRRRYDASTNLGEKLIRIMQKEQNSSQVPEETTQLGLWD